VERLVQWYRRANLFWQRILWWLVIGSLLLTLPVMADRYRTEHTSKKVEFVFDYRDLLEISDTKPNPVAFVEQQLQRMKQAGITSLAVYESTLNELKLARRIELYNSHEAGSMTSLTTSQVLPAANENFAYVLLVDANSRTAVKAMIEQTFSRRGVKIRDWSFKNTPGLVLELPLDEAAMKPMTPDPIALQALRNKGFEIVARLGNRINPFSPEELEASLALFKQYGANSILVDGESVPGYSADLKQTKTQLKTTAQLLNKYGMAIAAIELQKIPQKGFATLAKETDYNVIRLHSFTENEASRLMENITTEEQDSRIKGVTDRLVLAVKDRNIRLVFLNARASRNVDRGLFTEPLEPLYKSLEGKEGAIEQVKDMGFTIGKAHAFNRYESSLQKAGIFFAYTGAVLLIALTLSYFVPGLTLLLSALGLAGAGALHVVMPVAAEKLLALGSTSCAAALGIIAAIRYLQRKRLDAPAQGAWWKAAAALFMITAASVLGMLAVAGLLYDITYMLQINQFTGVKVLAYMPVLLAGIYLVFFSEELGFQGILAKVRAILASKISVLWVIAAGAIGVVGMYYLSRTGNEGSVSSIEMVFRNFLENTLGVRPRNKEFLFAHPLLIFGVYLSLRRHMAGLYIMLLGAIGQASAIGSFTHLHTPLWISFVRVLLGLGLGTVIGLILIAVWQLLAGGWKRWAIPLNK
jgi:hypothetical protein